MQTLFDASDDRYRSWLDRHPSGFVLNTRRKPDPNYMVLHRATCSSISSYHSNVTPGGFTERAYIKICADTVEEIRQWVRVHFGANLAFSAACNLCGPEA
jgi:hypothetical protein